MMNKAAKKNNEEFIELAKIVASELARDGVVQDFLHQKEPERIDYVLSYTDYVIRKMERMKTLYMTNIDFKEEFKKCVLEMLGK